MYNRYIPQSDGTYRRNSMPDRASQNPPRRTQEPSRPQKPPEKPCEQEKRETECNQKPSAPPAACPCSRQRCPNPGGRTCQSKPQKPCSESKSDGNVLDFLRSLLPKDFDTGDLLVVILLLLMAGDCKEDQNSALLTLVLYLFM